MADVEPALPSKQRIERVLADREVLLDTYNLRLPQGSGIKTYGVTLAESLRQLGATIALLSDRRSDSARRKSLGEVLFYDHEPRQSRVTGVFRNAMRGARRAVASVSSTCIDNRYVIPDRTMRLVAANRLFNVAEVYDVANNCYRRFGRFTTIRLPEKVDLWHATTALPIRMRNTPTVTTIHDLIPLRLPYTTLDDKKFFFDLVRDTLKRSDLIFSVSECTKRDILRFYDVPEEKILVTYQSVPFHIYQPNEALEESVMSRYGLPRKGYLLFVGNIEPKKNVRAVLQAASEIAEDVPLVIVGRKGWLWEDQIGQAQALFGRDIKRRFHLLDYVPKRELHALYANAMCLVFPSLYEGFGLPPLEAFAHGCPVIASAEGALPEVCGEAALYCDPYEPESIRQRIHELMNDDDLRDTLVDRGFERLEEFSPIRYAERLAVAYMKVI